MCTVTIARDDRTLRLACNRDECRTRTAARLPQVRAFGDRKAVLPIDPISGGTWIAANDAGLVLTLLNVNLETPHENHIHHQSRGRIIPALLELSSADEAIDVAAKLDPLSYLPFRLVAADDRTVGDVYSNGTTLHTQRRAHDALPMMFASSGLGDHVVDAPRRELFMRMFADKVDVAAAQDAFHHHVWPDRPELSVCMSRSDAMTVSYTVIELRSGEAVMRYQPGQPTDHAPATTVTLSLDEAHAR